MNRLKISAGVLILLGILCIAGMYTVYAECRNFTSQTESIIDAVASGNTESALEHCEALLGLWDKFHDRTGIFVDGEQLDPIREILAELPALIAAEHPEVMSRLEALRTLTEDLFLEEIPDIWHIL